MNITTYRSLYLCTFFGWTRALLASSFQKIPGLDPLFFIWRFLFRNANNIDFDRDNKMLKIGGDCPELQLESPQQKMISLKRIYKLKRLKTRFTTKFGGRFLKMTRFPKSHTLKSGQNPNPRSHLWMANLSFRRRKPLQQRHPKCSWESLQVMDDFGECWQWKQKTRRVGMDFRFFLGKINEQKWLD